MGAKATRSRRTRSGRRVGKSSSCSLTDEEQQRARLERRRQQKPAAYGLLSISIAFLSGTLPSIVQAANSLVGAMLGPLLAIFFLGVFFPICKRKGVTAGAMVGLFLASWHALGSISYPRASYGLPTSTAGCMDFNQTLTSGSFEAPHIPK
ncbi:sodium-dependent multivitamin transporter-like [Ixodes scapularis]